MSSRLIRCLLGCFLGLLCALPVAGQIGYTANDKVVLFNDYFLYGSNMDWRGTLWSDEKMADILCKEGINANSLRPALYDEFLYKYGSNIRVNTFAYYQTIGAKYNTLFITGPRREYRDERFLKSGINRREIVFKNIYTPIWIREGVVNPDNYFASFVHEVVKHYGRYVTFWEIYNEPDFTSSTNIGYQLPGAKKEVNGVEVTNNWWDEDPNPQDLVNFQAPIQYYVRTLRIAYEVIKYFNPEAMVCTGGIGYVSFLDAILRNTDNPDGGKVTDEYPYGGGAWFDYLCFHIYPMYGLKSWVGRDENHSDGFSYLRHTDRAVELVVDQKRQMDTVLAKYGYDGKVYPKKRAILTETNIPNVKLDQFIGSQAAQRNFVMKVALACQKMEVDAIYIFRPYDSHYFKGNTKDDPYRYMGFYKPLPDSPKGATLKMNEAGVAWRTMTRILARRRYDKQETARMELPASVDGGAFYSTEKNNYTYVLWAKTTKDQSEYSSASYRFPSSMNIQKMNVFLWHGRWLKYFGNELQLDGTPLFVESDQFVPQAILPVEASTLCRVSPNPTTDGEVTVTLTLHQEERVHLELYSMSGVQLKRFTPGLLDAGSYSFPFALNVPAGHYLLHVVGDRGFKEVCRIIVG